MAKLIRNCHFINRLLYLREIFPSHKRPVTRVLTEFLERNVTSTVFIRSSVYDLSLVPANFQNLFSFRNRID